MRILDATMTENSKIDNRIDFIVSFQPHYICQKFAMEHDWDINIQLFKKKKKK